MIKLSQGGNDLIDFEANKRDSLSSENFSKISNNPPVVSTNTPIAHKYSEAATGGVL